jgi:hypothetical protein
MSNTKERDELVIAFIQAIGNGMALSVPDRNRACQAAEYLRDRLASLPPEQAARGSFMTREQAIEFWRKRRPGIEPTEQHIAATIDAYSALFGDMVPADLAPAPTAQVQESLSEERVEAAAMEMASTHWHWDRLGEVERNGFRARARDVLTAAWGVQLTKEGGQ